MHAHTLDDWGLTGLADQMHEDMSEGPGHSDVFIDRLMVLKAKPQLGFDKAPARGRNTARHVQG
ncbi:hypothetical protein [Paracoccus salsus]|uniref:hypothetical protein n=1 Tax=Paracoccus salsus TaxID=2911061 RepID=UPI001F44CF26|nr:hypothetical protein [Paracoccus salsus]MCF3973208.1 hypothetical protein [Paracoccus salsus]